MAEALPLILKCRQFFQVALKKCRGHTTKLTTHQPSNGTIGADDHCALVVADANDFKAFEEVTRLGPKP
jgi:hypothetical protein